MEPKTIELSVNCDYLEVILIPDIHYDFISVKKEERLRAKDQKSIIKLHKRAYKQGIFRNEKPCS
jgi:hypothetical protein